VWQVYPNSQDTIAVGAPGSLPGEVPVSCSLSQPPTPGNPVFLACRNPTNSDYSVTTFCNYTNGGRIFLGEFNDPDPVCYFVALFAACQSDVPATTTRPGFGGPTIRPG
jgi:hypothetical protein